jgi:ABC-type arginine/histidine transport system permease subunit
MKTQRVIYNHASLMALTDCLAMALPISMHIIQAAQQKIIEMAVEREIVLRRDHPVIEQFWETYNYLNTKARDYVDGSSELIETLNHSCKAGLIAINLEHFR